MKLATSNDDLIDITEESIGLTNQIIRAKILHTIYQQRSDWTRKQ